MFNRRYRRCRSQIFCHGLISSVSSRSRLLFFPVCFCRRETHRHTRTSYSVEEPTQYPVTEDGIDESCFVWVFVAWFGVVLNNIHNSMNLCGAIANIGEGDQLLLEIPDERFQLTPRRDASSSVPSRRNSASSSKLESSRSPHYSRPLSSTHGKFRSSQSSSLVQSPTLLNPISKDDLKKTLGRKRSEAQASVVSKSSSLAIKNLQAGFKVVSMLLMKSWYKKT